MKWETGRQGQGYKKLSLMPRWLSKRLKADAYLLKIETGAYIPPHRDLAPEGYIHRRINFLISGSGVMYIHGPGPRPKYFTAFRRHQQWIMSFQPSEVEHSFKSKDGCILLSIGWLRSRGES